MHVCRTVEPGPVGPGATLDQDRVRGSSDGGAGVFGNTRIMCILGKVSQTTWRELVSTTNVGIIRGEEKYFLFNCGKFSWLRNHSKNAKKLPN